MPKTKINVKACRLIGDMLHIQFVDGFSYVFALDEIVDEMESGLTSLAPDVCPECAGSGKTGSVGLPHGCPYCDGTGKRR